jgi:hypothetical protein
MSYVSDHALYGLGAANNSYYRTGLGTLIDASTWQKSSSGVISAKSGMSGTQGAFTYLQTQANRVAAMKGWSQITVDGKLGSGTLALVNKIAAAYPQTIIAAANIDEVAKYAQEYGDTFRGTAASGGTVTGLAPSFYTPPVVASYAPTPSTPSSFVSSAPPVNAPVAAPKPVVQQFKIAAPQAPLRAGFALPSAKWLLIAGGAAAVLMIIMSGRKKSAPVAAAVTAPAVPKGV